MLSLERKKVSKMKIHSSQMFKSAFVFIIVICWNLISEVI